MAGASGGLQATTVAHRLLRLVRVGGRPRARVPAGTGAAAPSAGAGAVAAAGSVPAAAPAAPAAPAAVAMSGTASTAVAAGGALAGVLARARAAGGSPAAVDGLAEIWPTLGARDRAQVAHPLGSGPGLVRLGAEPARQTDETTCGSAVLTLLAAAGDPFLALWLVTGRLVADGPGHHHRPPELRGAGRSDLAAAGAGERFGAVQRAVKRASTRTALGPFPWPGALGTPPWGAARTARFPGVAYTSVLVDDTDTEHLSAVLDRADAALARGVPVPLYTGGDLSRGVAAALPRHVVLLVPPHGPGRGGPGAAGAPAYAVYEPASGRVHRLTRAEVLAPSGPRAALGRWSHVCWAVLPRG